MKPTILNKTQKQLAINILKDCLELIGKGNHEFICFAFRADDNKAFSRGDFMHRERCFDWFIQQKPTESNHKEFFNIWLIHSDYERNTLEPEEVAWFDSEDVKSRIKFINHLLTILEA